MTNNFKKDNHFVQQAYLRNWESSHKKVWMYRTLVSHQNVPIWKEASCEAIAYHTHLYTRIIAGKENDGIENWLEKEYETPAAASIKKVIAETKLTPKDWFHLIRYLSAQDVRTPSRLMEVTKRQNDTFQEMLDDTLLNSVNKIEEIIKNKEVIVTEKNELSDNLPIKVHYDKQNGNIKVKGIVGRSSWLWSMKHLLNHTASILHTHKWTIIKPAKGYTWLTSDNPVLRLNFHNLEKYDFGGNWGVDGTNILMPLSPYHLLYTEIGKKPPIRGTRFNKEKTILIRRFLAENASRMIFTNEINQEIIHFRQRVVNPLMVENEKKLWEGWHKSQSELEHNLELWKDNLTKKLQEKS